MDELIRDCGKASKMTKGLFFGGFMESSIPPFSYCPNPEGADCHYPQAKDDPLGALRAQYELEEQTKK